MRFAVLASGNGTNLQAIISAVKSKKIKAQLGLVVSDKKKAYVLTRALKAGIPVTVVDPKKFKTTNEPSFYFQYAKLNSVLCFSERQDLFE